MNFIDLDCRYLEICKDAKMSDEKTKYYFETP